MEGTSRLSRNAYPIQIIINKIYVMAYYWPNLSILVLMLLCPSLLFMFYPYIEISRDPREPAVTELTVISGFINQQNLCERNELVTLKISDR